MLFNVPQYIDVEDKVAGPLTAKQLGWMIVMFVILVAMWLMIPSRVIFFLLAIPVVLIFVGLAFVKVYGQTMISLVVAGFNFVLNPKVYVWKRIPEHMKSNMKKKQQEAKAETAQIKHEEDKKKMLKNLSELAKIMDSGGSQANSDVVAMLKKPPTKK